MPGNELLGSRHIPVGNRSNDLGGFVRREINPHDRTSLRDVHVRRRVIEGVDPHLKSIPSNNRWHDYT
jgi:hypothetical protein